MGLLERAARYRKDSTGQAGKKTAPPGDRRPSAAQAGQAGNEAESGTVDAQAPDRT